MYPEQPQSPQQPIPQPAAAPADPYTMPQPVPPPQPQPPQHLAQPQYNPTPQAAPIQSPFEPTHDGTRYQQPEYPVDYLNQISSTPQARPLSLKMIIGAVIAGLLIMGGVAALLFTTTAEPDIKTRAATLNARLLTLKDISEKQHTRLKSSDLRAVNSSMRQVLQTSSTSLGTAIQQQYDIENLSKTLTKSETAKETAYASKITTTFDEAALNGTIDRIYAREIIYQLSLLSPQIDSILKDTNNQTITKSLQTAKTDLEKIQQTFSDSSASLAVMNLRPLARSYAA